MSKSNVATSSGAALALLYLVAWFALPWLCLQGGTGDRADWLLTAGGLSIAHATVAVATLGLRGRFRSAIVVIYATFVSLLVVFLLAYGFYLSSGGTISSDAMRAVAQTDALEAIGYFRKILAGTHVLIASATVLTFVLMLVPLVLWRLPAPSFRFSGTCLSMALTMVGIGGSAVLSPVVSYIAEYRQEVRAFRRLLAERRATPIRNASARLDANFIIVIGESTSRHHMGLYGYMRDTTPALDLRAEKLVVFRDVISAHSHTVPALGSALTSSGVAEVGPSSDASIDIVSLASAAGFRTFWWSNQNEFGLWDTPISAIGQGAHHSRFSSGLGNAFRRPKRDEELLAGVKAALGEVRAGAAVFVHLFSAHWPYCENYPPELEHFTRPLGMNLPGGISPRDVNCYDNSVRYIDGLLEQIIGLAESNSTPTAAFYFSDHGEAPLLGTSHESTYHSSYHIEIPMLLWANGPFRDSRSDLIAAARRNAGRPYSTARLYHSLGHLLGIDHDSVRPEHSVFSDRLVDVPRESLGGRIKYDAWATDNDYRENSRVTLARLESARSKVWAHPINSTASSYESLHIIDGVEMDVVFMDERRCFHVFHPPSPDRGLSLDELLAVAARKPQLRIWLDWKNAEQQNVAAALQCLARIDAKYGIRGRTLVETGSTAIFDETRSISAAGYQHGYYLPTDEIQQCLGQCSEARSRQLARSIIDTVKAGGYTAMTFDWSLSDFVKLWLRDWAVASGISLYSWDMQIDVAA
jgi:heptose-I-phosphate ethanolaminephosphotransferase